ncbi:MAG: AEC family transporter [Anaerolineales bacterium]
MFNVIESIFPVFAMAGLGYAAALMGILRAKDVDGLSRFVFSLALPLLLFDSLANSVWPGSFDWAFLFAFYSVSYLIFGLGILVGRIWFGLQPAEQAIFGLGASYSNLVLVGLPIISTGLGELAVLPLLALVSVQNLLLFPLVALVAHPRDAGDKLLVRLWKSAKGVAANPLLIGLAAGFIARVFSIHLPQLIGDPIHLVGQAGLPCALIVLGASFHRYEIGRPTRAAFTMVGFKMLLQPMLVWLLAFWVLQLDPLWGAVAVMAAAMPTGINAYVLAEQMGAGQKTVAASVWMSSLLAVLIQTGLLALFIDKV